MKLTKTEIRALNEMTRVPRVTERFMPLTVMRLASEGLVERTFSVVGYQRQYWQITEAGRAALEESRMTPVTKLSALTRCPVCGEARDVDGCSASDLAVHADFSCGAIFVTSNYHKVLVITPCPIPSRLSDFQGWNLSRTHLLSNRSQRLTG